MQKGPWILSRKVANNRCCPGQPSPLLIWFEQYGPGFVFLVSTWAIGSKTQIQVLPVKPRIGPGDGLVGGRTVLGDRLSPDCPRMAAYPEDSAQEAADSHQTVVDIRLRAGSLNIDTRPGQSWLLSGGLLGRGRRTYQPSQCPMRSLWEPQELPPSPSPDPMGIPSHGERIMTIMRAVTHTHVHSALQVTKWFTYIISSVPHNSPVR